MSESNFNTVPENSAIKKIKERSALKKQLIAIVSVACAIAVLIVALLVVLYFIEIYTYPDLDGTDYYIKKVNGVYELCYKSGDPLDKNSDGYYQTDLGTLVQIDPATGDWKRYAVVDTYETEEVGYAQYVMMFKQLTYDASSTKDSSKVIKSIEIHNEFGSYTFERAEANNFVIKEHPNAPYNRETFAQLAVACGYTLSMHRLENPKTLENGETDYAEYGLAAEKRTKTVTDEEGNETQVEYDYAPAWYVITTMTGEKHKVILGDMVVTGAGYYARYDGRDTIYVLGSSGFKDVLLQKLENIVTPTIVYPMAMMEYFSVKDFIIYDNIDYDAIYEDLKNEFGDPDELEEGSIDEEKFLESYDKAFLAHSHKACHFTYQDLDERQGTMYSYLPYVSNLEYAGGYYINSTNIDKVLYALYQTEFTSVEKLDPTDEDFEKYGLDEAPYVVTYYFVKQDDNGQTMYIPNYFEVSAKTEDGIFYAYASEYNMIVGVSESSFEFLEWEELAWYDQSYIQLDISHVTDIKVESPEYSIHFEIDDSASRYMTYIARTGTGFKENITDASGKTTAVQYTVKKDALTGKYVLTNNGKRVNSAYSGDYLITPLVYTKGTPQAENYLFYETKPVDLDSDGNNDANTYYFYNVVPNNGEYYLATTAYMADNQGNKLTNDTSIMGQPYMSTEYFVTNSGYIYLTAKDSHLGKEIDELYGKYNRGRWANGNFFVTANNQHVLVNSETGEWSIIDDISCGIYFGDDQTSRLAQRAVEITAKYNESGKLTRYPETYYAISENKLRYDDENGIQVYNNDKKEWESATYSDCTIGIWNTGAYYITDSGNIVVVNEETGDWGLATVSANETYVAEIFADGELLDYNIKTTNHVGKEVNSSTMDNFKQFYGALLYASLEGMAELTDEEKAELRALDCFDESGKDTACQLKITVLGEDPYGNRRDIVYRFYQYTERKSYITIEALSSPDAESSSEIAYGNFYVLRSFADKIIEDAIRIANAQEVTAVTKY